MKIKLRWLKEGLVLSVEVPVVLYQVITGQKSSQWLPHFQLVNFTGSPRLATTGEDLKAWDKLAVEENRVQNDNMSTILYLKELNTL